MKPVLHIHVVPHFEFTVVEDLQHRNREQLLLETGFQSSFWHVGDYRLPEAKDSFSHVLLSGHNSFVASCFILALADNAGEHCSHSSWHKGENMTPPLYLCSVEGNVRGYAFPPIFLLASQSVCKGSYQELIIRGARRFSPQRNNPAMGKFPVHQLIFPVDGAFFKLILLNGSSLMSIDTVVIRGRVVKWLEYQIRLRILVYKSFSSHDVWADLGPASVTQFNLLWNAVVWTGLGIRKRRGMHCKKGGINL